MMLDISEHTAEYELDRDATYYDDFGREYIEAFLPQDFDTELIDKLGTYKFGEAVAKKIGASITDYGMISERGRLLSEMVYKEDKLPVIFDDGEENEQSEQAEDAEDISEADEDIEEQPPDEEQSDDPEQALTDEHYEVVEIFGQEALFTESTIHDSEIPEGMYRYDFRSLRRQRQRPAWYAAVSF